MLDVRLIREDPERLKAAIATTFTDAPIGEIVTLDERRRALLTDVESLKAELNAGSKEVGRTKDPAERESLIGRMRELGDRIRGLDEEVKDVEAQLQRLMLHVPNVPLEHVPVAPDESGNVVVAEYGATRAFDFA
ncbi:MAG: serine--tRNA ligase, partial [Chloroflexi bacterium]|nr:serine--tRNA ligase [Chloroflexota bacterium]